MDELCPACQWPLLWVPARAPASLGFCEDCGAYWHHRPESGTTDCTEEVYGRLGQGSPAVDVAGFRAGDAAGRIARRGAALDLREWAAQLN
jgi:hypothetical protein